MAALYEHDVAGSPESLSFSNLYPSRPIRPLPKRRLRERLSPEVAESIEYPPSAQPTSIFYPAYSTDNVEEEYRKESATPSAGDAKLNSSMRRFTGSGSGITNGVRSEGDEDGLARSAMVTRSPPDILNRAGARQSSKSGQPRQTALQQPQSTDSSADGYDSFENTNNKKKRKIPTAGDSSLNGNHSLGDGGTIAVSAGSSTTHLHGGTVETSLSATNASSTNNKGISGAGRGTFGRSRNGRSPLRSLSNASNWAERATKSRPAAQWATPPNENPVSGIISTAIAKAEKHSIPQGQENVSLLQQHSTKSTPASTQFTFTCESQVPGTHWPGADPGLSHLPPPIYAPSHSQKQQPMPAPARGGGAKGNAPAPGPDASQEETAESAASRERKARRKVNRELARQERQRRQKAQEERRRNPPTGEEWVCDFCVYKNIFGKKPKALIRGFEEKVRQERIDEETRRQRLERAKARSRKGKKPAKSGGKSATPQKQPQDLPEGDVGAPVDDEPGSEDDGTSEDYVDESSSPVDDDKPIEYEGAPIQDGGGGNTSSGHIGVEADPPPPRTRLATVLT